MAHRDYLACVGAWIVILADAWRVGSRTEGVSADDLDLDGDLRSALQGVRLLDDEGRIPAGSWTKWAGTALEEVSRRAEVRSQISSLGGRSRAGSASRAGGRFLPAGSQPEAGPAPAVVQPSAGDPPAGHQPSPAKTKKETEKEKERVSRGGGSREEEYRGILLTRKQLDQWKAWDEETSRSHQPRLWEPVKRAWLGRGLRHPPTPRQRDVLWEILDARPTDLPRWIREADPGMTSGRLIAFLLEEWHRIQREAEAREIPRPTNSGMVSLGEILAKVPR